MRPETRQLLETLRGKLRVVIVCQFAGWWKLTPEAWGEMIDRSIEAWETDTVYEWNLNELGRPLRRPPYNDVWTGVWTNRDGTRSGRHISPKRDGVICYQMPCDWKEGDWKQARYDLEEMAKCKPTT